MGIMRNPRVLLAWELGANRGHVTALGRVAQELSERGARVTFAVQRLDAMRALRPLDPSWSIVQAPVWPGLIVASGFRLSQPTASFGDILANSGLRDSAVVEFLLRGWDGLLTATGADVVITNFAPIAQLSARGRVPVVAAGNGFTLPPDHLPEFPPLLKARPTYPEDQLLQAVNLGLERTGRAGLSHLPEIMSADRRMPHSLRIFDPYESVRLEQMLAPILPGWTPVRPAGGDEIFVYFAETTPRAEHIFEAFARMGRSVRIHVPNLPAATARKLAAAGASVEPKPLPVADIARRCRLVISHGGLGLVSMTLAAGLPQLVLAPDLEKRLIGETIVRLGVGRLVRWRDVDVEVILAAVDLLLADESTRERACRLGAELTSLLQENSAGRIAEAALSLCS